MFLALDGQTVSEINWTALNCKWDESSKSNKLWSKGGNPYVDAKKGTCDDGSYEEINGEIRQFWDVCCDQEEDSNRCGPMSYCTAMSNSATTPFHGPGYVCTCKTGYIMLDGVCVQSDPCLDNNGGCHVDADCQATYLQCLNL